MGSKKRRAQSTRQRDRRRLIVVAVVLLLLVAGASFALKRLVGGITDEITPRDNAASEFAGGDAALVYVDLAGASDLHHLDLTDGSDEVVASLSQQGHTEAAPGSRWLSVEVTGESGADAKPVIYVFDPETEEETLLGTGFGPVWSPDGKLVAWNQPEDESKCGLDDCSGDISVVVTDPETGETTPWTEPGPYEVQAWSGDHLILQDSPPGGEPILQSVSSDGELERLSIRPIDLWGVSPDGRWAIQSGDEAPAMFLEMEDGQVTGQGEPIGIREGTKLGGGAWSHDSSQVGAFAVGEGTSLVFVTFGPDDPNPVELTEGGEASTGTVVWTPDNDGVVFQRFTGDELEAVHCPLDGDCESVLSWTTGITLLRVE